MALRTFDQSAQEAKAGGSLHSRSAQTTQQVPGQTRLHRETPYLKTEQNKNTNAREMAQTTKCLLHKHEDPSSVIQHSHKNEYINKNKTKCCRGIFRTPALQAQAQADSCSCGQLANLTKSMSSRFRERSCLKT